MCNEKAPQRCRPLRGFGFHGGRGRNRTADTGIFNGWVDEIGRLAKDKNGLTAPFVRGWLSGLLPSDPIHYLMDNHLVEEARLFGGGEGKRTHGDKNG